MTQNRMIHLTKEVAMPMVGFGTYLISNDDAPLAVSNAIRSGYRHIDTAEVYQNEEGVGAGIHTVLKSEELSRDQIFVTTKLWPGNAQWGETPKTFETTIESLRYSRVTS